MKQISNKEYERYQKYQIEINLPKMKKAAPWRITPQDVATACFGTSDRYSWESRPLKKGI